MLTLKSKQTCTIKQTSSRVVFICWRAGLHCIVLQTNPGISVGCGRGITGAAAAAPLCEMLPVKNTLTGQCIHLCAIFRRGGLLFALSCFIWDCLFVGLPAVIGGL